MRQIKFRGKRTDGGGWVYGDLIHHYVFHEGFLTIVQNGCIYYKVFPATVGQFTGLHDKNGKEIWEGDTDGHGNVVEYCNGSFCLNGDRLLTSSFEVIGNIHDNPELVNN